MHHHDDQVIAEASRLLVIPAHELPARLNQLIGAKHFGCVQAAVNPHNPLPFLGECTGISLAHPFRARETLGNRPIALTIAEILRARDDRHHLRATLGGHANRVEIHPIRLVGEPNPVLVELGIVGKDVVGADIMAEVVLGRGQPLLRGGRQGENGGQRYGATEGTPRHRAELQVGVGYHAILRAPGLGRWEWAFCLVHPQIQGIRRLRLRSPTRWASDGTSSCPA